MKSFIWNLFVATNQWLSEMFWQSVTIFFAVISLFLETRMSSFFCHGHSGLPLPLCCDGLALLEQGLHALSFGVSLLASVLLFTWLLLSLWLTTCSCEMFSLFRRLFLHFWSILSDSNQWKTFWPSFIIGADIVGRNGDFVLKADRLPVNETQLFVCLFFASSYLFLIFR